MYLEYLLLNGSDTPLFLGSLIRMKGRPLVCKLVPPSLPERLVECKRKPGDEDRRMMWVGLGVCYTRTKNKRTPLVTKRCLVV